MKTLKIVGLLVLMISVTQANYAQKDGETLPFETYRQVEKALERDVRNHRDALTNEMEAQRNEWTAEMNDKVHEVRDASFRIELMIWALGGMTFAGWLGFGWGAVRYVRKQVREFVHEQVKEEYPDLVNRRLKEMMKEDSEELTELINQQSFEYKAKEEMAFPVLCANKTDIVEARNLIEGKLGYEKASFQLFDDFKDNHQHPIVIIYDFNDHLINEKETAVQEILADAKQYGKDTIYLLATQRHWPALNHYRDQANAANSKFTLAARMMESLNFSAQQNKV